MFGATNELRSQCTKGVGARIAHWNGAQGVWDRHDEEDVLSVSRCQPCLYVDPKHGEVGVLVEDRAVVWEETGS